MSATPSSSLPAANSPQPSDALTDIEDDFDGEDLGDRQPGVCTFEPGCPSCE